MTREDSAFSGDFWTIDAQKSVSLTGDRWVHCDTSITQGSATSRSPTLARPHFTRPTRTRAHIQRVQFPRNILGTKEFHDPGLRLSFYTL